MSEVLEAPAETAFPVGIGRFQIIEQLGSGLQGTVYKGYDPHLDRLVAIKLLNGSPMPGPADGRVSEGRASRHALEEGRNLGRLKHTNVIPVYEAGLHQGCPFLVFEYVEGTTLQNYLRQHGRLSVGTATVLMSQLVSGLAHAHQQEVLHLDLSPGNIQIDIDGVPRIMDFGLSRVKSQQHESGDALVGTPRYMTPEHFATGRLGAATDVFALALIWYEALAGQPAIQGSSTAEIEAAILGIAIEPPALEALGVDQWLATIVCKALHRDPTKRIQDACAFKDLLDRHVAARRSPPAATAQAANHSTVEFLLRRMARKQDFPALSNNLVVINCLTADDSTAAGDELAKVVLRDYAVSNKLLKLANSAYFGSNGGSITKVSDAISRLGFDRVRMACTSLMYFSHTQGGEGTAELQELQISAFMSGLIARHLAFAACAAAIPKRRSSAACSATSAARSRAIIFRKTAARYANWSRPTASPKRGRFARPSVWAPTNSAWPWRAPGNFPTCSFTAWKPSARRRSPNRRTSLTACARWRSSPTNCASLRSCRQPATGGTP